MSSQSYILQSITNQSPQGCQAMTPLPYLGLVQGGGAIDDSKINLKLAPDEIRNIFNGGPAPDVGGPTSDVDNTIAQAPIQRWPMTIDYATAMPMTIDYATAPRISSSAARELNVPMQSPGVVETSRDDKKLMMMFAGATAVLFVLSRLHG